ncbi:hypothetical protein [Streptomyces drozdowiczii]|uniref:Uncharacterized protein n=1 Tax=Streptomyces drozdowiczii TaxID=202862 RepID=A0ABY6PRR1_9ACTN|nr:hypothetical protein [Streptomyces drozdowiczii]MCX0245720.1 hypothetical protein [Streptomyces drozdowiczii]UZK54674.1 hypothetical protein NEH16_11480 [Streptomyces drozdowiczii]
MTVALITVGALIAVAAVAGLVGLVVFAHAYGEVHADMRYPYDDVTVTSCRMDEETRRPVAGVRITSEAARRGTYTVHLVFRDRAAGSGKDAAAGKRTLVVKDLAVGATVSDRVVGPDAVPGPPECEVAEVTFRSTAGAATVSPRPSPSAS